MQHPSWLTKPPCFDRGLSEEGNECFSSALVERGLSCVAALPGGAGSWVGYVIMSILPPVVPQIRAAPVTPKEAPGLATGSSSGSLFSLGSKAALHFPQDAQAWLTAEEGQFKDIYTVRLQVLFVLGNKLSVPAITSRSPCFFSTQVYSDSGRAGAMSRTRDGKTEMSVQSRARLLNGSRRLAEVSVFPSVPCLRRSVSAPEIPCLRRPVPCPQAMATLAWGEHAGYTGGTTAGFLCHVDIAGRTRRFTVRIYVVICRLKYV